jgi:pimeloyl-ACP methyl ester carboxylesterase
LTSIRCIEARRTTVPTVSIDDATLYYERDGAGPAMLFVHGMCGDADVWADQADRFAAHDTCVRYDRRGYSRSSRGDAPLSVTRHADDTAALIQTLELAPCLLVGSSSGAVIALDVACRHGHLMRGVVLSEPPLFSLDPDAGRSLIGELGPRVDRAMATGGPAAAVDAFFTLVCPGLWSTLDEDRKDRYRANGEIGFADLRAPSIDVTQADLARVTVPALVIAGDSSHPAFGSIARGMAGALADARFVELADCGHVTYAEQPDAFAQAVRSFVAELERRAPITSA